MQAYNERWRIGMLLPGMPSVRERHRQCWTYSSADIQQVIRVLTPLAQHLVFVSSDFVYDPTRRRIP